MIIEVRQRSASNVSNRNTSQDRAHRRGPVPPSLDTRALLSPPNGNSPYSQLLPGGANRPTSPRGRAHTVADPHLHQRQLSQSQSHAHPTNMSFYPPPPPPPQPTSTPSSHIRLPGPPPRPSTSNQHGGMPMAGQHYWNPPPGQYPQQQQQQYNPGLYQHPSYTTLPPPPSVRPPLQQQQQQQRSEPLTSATYVPDGASFGPGMLYIPFHERMTI